MVNGLVKGKKGSLHHNSKLTNNEVLQIKALIMKGVLTKSYIGKIYNVTCACVSIIGNGKNWSHIRIKDYKCI